MITIRHFFRRSLHIYSIRSCSKKSDFNFIDEQYFSTTQEIKLNKKNQESETDIEEEQKPIDILGSNSEANFFDEYYFRGEIKGRSSVENISSEPLQTPQ